MKDYLEKFIDSKKSEMAEVRKTIDSSNDVNEVRSLGATLEKLRNEINDAEDEARKWAQQKEAAGKENDKDDKRFNALAVYGTEKREVATGRDSMEYRTAFMNFVQRGEMSPILETRSDNPGVTSDLGVMIPMHIMNQIIEGVQKVYGQLYSRVNKTNLKGGVKYPIGSFDATFHRIGELGAPADRQKGGQITSYVEFSYKLGEVRIAQSLMAWNMGVELFEQKLSQTIVESYVRAMDKEILNGGNSTLYPTEYSNQCEGILTEAAKGSTSRIPSSNIIEFTASELADWKKWQKNLFAKIPLSMRGLKPQFVFTAATYETNIKTLHDDVNRPLSTELFNLANGEEIMRFRGREVVLVEEGNGIETYDDASNGEYFGMYWVPEKAYSINTNLEFFVKRYFDEEKLVWVDRAVVINDGKILDPKYIWLLKKKV